MSASAFFNKTKFITLSGYNFNDHTVRRAVAKAKASLTSFFFFASDNLALAPHTVIAVAL